jgi:hypothetical protein
MTSGDDTAIYVARLSADGRGVLCGACDEQIASVTVRGRKRDYRELWLLPGWERHRDGAWHPIQFTCDRLRRGRKPGYRKPQRMILNTVVRHVKKPGQKPRLERLDGPGKERYGQFSSPITDFSTAVVVVCCAEHRNALDAKRLNVVTDDDRRRLFGLRE